MLTLEEPESSSPLKIGIFCEGETEQRYIQYLAKFLEIQDKVDVQVTTNKDPGVVFQDHRSAVPVGPASWEGEVFGNLARL